MKRNLPLLLFLIFSGTNRLLANIPVNIAPKQVQTVSFTENKGQVHDQFYRSRPDVLFSGNCRNGLFHLRNSGISYQFNRVDTWREEDLPNSMEKREVPEYNTIYRLDVNWLNCNLKAGTGIDEALPGYKNYYNAVCPDGVQHVKDYTGVTLKNIYHGIDLHYYGKEGLKYDYLVSPGADYKQIQLEILGAERIDLRTDGGVDITTALGKVTEDAPLVIQQGSVLPSKWLLKNNILTFDITGVDPAFPFIIDPPVRMWGTYYGGSGDDRDAGCTTDKFGNVYQAGNTISGNLATQGTHQSSLIGLKDAYLVKFNSQGTRLWATYYGSSGSTAPVGVYPGGCAADASGNIYMSGSTSASNGNEITTPGCHQASCAGVNDAFLVKFDVSGLRLWATYYGGAGIDAGADCVTDASGNVYLAGYTNSQQNISTPGAFQVANTGNYNAFVVKFNASGVRQWGTYYGDDCSGAAIDLDPKGNIFLAGRTGDLSTTCSSPGCHQSANGGGGGDAFLVKFTAAGMRVWGTYYGGSAHENGNNCATDKNGNIYLCGTTHSASSSAIVTPGAHQTIPSGSYDGYLVKFDSLGVRQWGTLYGGNIYDEGYGCATDAAGSIFLAGYTTSNGSSTVIATVGSHQPTLIGPQSAYLVKFNPSGVRLWGTYYNTNGGNASSCATHSAGYIYMSGITQDPTSLGIFNLVATPGSFQPSYGGHVYDSWLAQFYECPASGLTANASQTSICVGQSVVLSASGANNYTWNPGGNLPTYTVTPNITTVYTLSGSSSTDCIVTTSVLIFVQSCQGIEENSVSDDSEIKLYPNPHNGIFYLESEIGMDLIIYNSQGQLVRSLRLQGGKNKIDMSDKAEGIYFFRYDQRKYYNAKMTLMK